MAIFNRPILTNAGADLIARALSGEKIIFTKIVLGAGSTSEAETLTNVVIPKVEGGIVHSERQGDVVKLTTTIINSGVSADFLNTEIGVFAKVEGDVEDILYSYTTAEKADWIASNSLGTSLELKIDIYITIDSEVNTSYEINETISFLTTQLADDRYASYHVGDIYLTLSSLHPSLRWTGTTWKKITDKFLLGGGLGYPVGSTGGLTTQRLGINQIPSHRHDIIGAINASGSHNHTTHSHKHRVDAHAHSTAAHTHILFGNTHETTALGVNDGLAAAAPASVQADINGKSYVIGRSRGLPTQGISSPSAPVTHHSAPYTNAISMPTYYSGNHRHEFNLEASQEGGGEEFSILNPYLAINIWQRLS